MFADQLRIGLPVTWSIGPRGGTPDRYPARVVSRPVVTQMNGQIVTVVEIIALRKTRDGSTEYTSGRTVNARFLEPRALRAEALDGTADEALSVPALLEQHSKNIATFQASRAEAMDVDALAAEALTL